MGWENVFHCEWNEFGKKVLKYYWPKAISYHDIKETDFTIHRGSIDILTGGFPCQPYSQAGKRKGKEDERHLWPEMLRAIREIQPSWIVGENVYGLINWNGGMVFDEVQAELEAEGYEVWPYVLPACGVNAPHRRDRIWFVAHNKNHRPKSRLKQGQSDGIRKRGLHEHQEKGWDEVRAERERFTEIQPTSDPDNPRAGQRLRTNPNVEEENKGREGQPQSEFREDGETPPHSDSNGLKRSDSEHEKHTSKGGEYALNDIEQVTTANPSRSRRLQDNQQQPPNQLKYVSSGWLNFPTQPPICSRNDGISDRLDSITFPKWRSESIKAYGNAIVPQVVYQIFKAIEKYES